MATTGLVLSSDSSQGTASLSLRSSIKYVTDPPKWLLCPDCDQLLLEPVIAVGCGHTFCRSCSDRLKETNRPCPLDNTPSGANHFVPNRALGVQIDELKVYCPNGGVRSEDSSEGTDLSTGCTETMKLGELSVHLATCPFGLVDCPQAGQVCGQIHRKDLAHHLEVCAHCSCIYCAVGGCACMCRTLPWKYAVLIMCILDSLKTGCSYHGTKGEVELHQRECPHAEAGEKQSLQELIKEVCRTCCLAPG